MRLKRTDQTLLEQMRITDFEIEHRKILFSFTEKDVQTLVKMKPMVEQKIDALVEHFYELQTSIPEISLLIGDADTLARLRNAQRKYVLDLFGGFYDLEYVNNRLRIGMVHKRIGVEPKLYLAAIHSLKDLLFSLVEELIEAQDERAKIIGALEKLMMFDIALVFETYIRSLISEIEISKDKSERYARSLEEKVRERTLELEKQSRTDPLTGLLNMRHLKEILTKIIRCAQRRSEIVTFAYMDIDNFKEMNDTLGHQYGDNILCSVANALKKSFRAEDNCFRYGGDEFCVVMAGCTQNEAENMFKNRLLQELDEKRAGLTLSIGFSQTGPIEFCTADELIQQADQKMYEAKKFTKSQKPSKEVS